MPMTPGRGLAAAIFATAAPLLAQSIPVTEHTLSNGMRLLLVERRDQPTVATGWIARVGSANERPGTTGMAHLFEHLMFKGTRAIGTRNLQRDLQLNDLQDRLRLEIMKEESLLRERQKRGEIADMYDPKVRTPRHQKLLDEFGKLVKEQQDLLVKGEFDTIYTKAGSPGTNAFTSQDVTCYILTVPSNKLELWAWMESDRLRQPVFREFYAERDVVMEERRLRTESTPLGKFEEAFQSMVWTAHPYHWPVIGWASDVNSITRDQANTFFRTYYAPNNVTAVLVGDFDTKEAIALCERYFGRIPANPAGVPELVTLEPAANAEKRMYAEAETLPSVEIAWKTVASAHKDQYALDLLSQILNGPSGRLNRALVLDQKVATTTRAGHDSRKYHGLFSIRGTAVNGHKPEEVEEAIYREIERIKAEGINATELRKVKNQAQANAFRRQEDNFFLMIQLAAADATTGYKAFLEEPALTEAVTAEDIQRVARTYFTRENRNVAIYTRKAGAAAEDPALAALPEQAKPMVKAMLAQFAAEKDPAKLKEVVAALEAKAGQVPADFKPALDLVIARVREQIQKLEAK